MAKRDSVLVIGGTGFIGRVLVAKLRERGCAVRVLTRRADLGGDGGVGYVQGDVTDRASILRAADGIDVVYDLSMAFGETWADYERVIIKGAENVAAVVLERGIRRLVYTSTIAGLHLAARGRIDEAAGPDPKPELRSFYPRAKIRAEAALGRLHRERALPVVLFRPGIVVGVGNKLSHPGLGVWTSPTVCTVVGGGRTPLPLVLVEDVAAALVLAKDAPGVDGRTFNLVGDVRLSAAEYVAVAAERSKRNFRLVTRSPWAILAFQATVWLGKRLLGREDNAWQSWYELENLPQRTFLDCSAAKEALGWRPVADRDEFVRRAIDCHLAPLHPEDLQADERSRRLTAIARDRAGASARSSRPAPPSGAARRSSRRPRAAAPARPF